MAIYHLSVKPMSRASGRSAVAAAAYRSGELLVNERDGLTHDYARRSGVEHAEVVIPAGSNAQWALEREALWNVAEVSEKRKDARVSREVEVALPHELDADQRKALVQEFAQGLADRYGVAVDFAIHSPHSESDKRNHHAHIMMTTRQLPRNDVGGLGDGASVPTRLGDKSLLELENKKLLALGAATSHEQVRELRVLWEERTNAHLAMAGVEARVDHRSYGERGLQIAPTQHVGVHATQMQRRGKEVTRVRVDDEVARRNAELIRERPEQVLAIITGEKSVFDRRDVARALHRYTEGAEEFEAAFLKVMSSPALVELQPERRVESADGRGEVLEGARYSTREMVEVEQGMAVSADRLAGSGSCAVPARAVQAALESRSFLSAEQRAAVEAVTGAERVAVVVGLAGAGKSTMLAAAREAWEAAGYQVRGAALAGKAAEGLSESAGIASRTLASWDRGWGRGFDTLGAKDVFVIDEAGMVGSKQLSRFIQEADRAGAKVVLVGDPEQLQPIGAGAAFRAVAERVGFVELEGVRRQQQDWQRAASVDFGRHRTEQGLAAYAEHGAVRLEGSSQEAVSAIVRDVTADMVERPGGSRLVLAHRRVDVSALNESIRAARRERGELVGERVYATSEGERAFAVGDRLLFRENSRELAVKNGMLGTVQRVAGGRLEVALDSDKGEGLGRTVEVSTADYAAVDHGYATTIHKSQGSTVDRAYVLASGTMDRHLTYVAMTRHREAVQLYAGRDEFRDVAALTKRLSRSQAKETTLDYEVGGQPRRSVQPGYAEHAFAQRRGIELEGEIVVPREVAVAAPAVPEKKRGMFDGLKLKSVRTGEKAAAPASKEVAQAERREALPQAVERYAKAWSDAVRMHRQGLPVLQAQKTALREAGVAVEAQRPGGLQELRNALEYQPPARTALVQLQGRERADRLMEAMGQEQQILRSPQLRAERMMLVWKRLEEQALQEGPAAEKSQAGKLVKERMQAVIEQVKGDPQLLKAVLALRKNTPEKEAGPERSLVRRLTESEQDRERERRRDQDRGRGLSR